MKKPILKLHENAFVNTQEAAKYLGLSALTLKNWRTSKKENYRLNSPPFYKVGRKVLYRIIDLKNHLEANKVTVKQI